MANTGYIKFNTKDIVSVIQEETADKITQEFADSRYALKSESGSGDYIPKIGDAGKTAIYSDVEIHQIDGEQTFDVGIDSPDSILFSAEGPATPGVIVNFVSPPSQKTAVKILTFMANRFHVMGLTLNNATWVNDGVAPDWYGPGSELILAVHFINGQIFLSVVHIHNSDSSDGNTGGTAGG